VHLGPEHVLDCGHDYKKNTRAEIQKYTPPFIYAMPIFAWLKDQGKYSYHYFFLAKSQLIFIMSLVTLCMCFTPEVCIPEASLSRKMRISLAKMNFSDFIISLA
jgi:hypothetical protein